MKFLCVRGGSMRARQPAALSLSSFADSSAVSSVHIFLLIARHTGSVFSSVAFLLFFLTFFSVSLFHCARSHQS